MAIDGLVSGLDTDSIIKGLMDLERIPVNLMETRQANEQLKIAAYDSILAKLSAISTAANNLERPNDWTVFGASSSNLSVATATVANSAAAGSLTFRVAQLASQHALTSAQTYANRTDQLAPSGTVSLTIGTETTNLAVGTGTIDEVASAINSAGLGLRATVVNTGSGFRMQVSSNKTGAANQFEISGFDTVVTAEGKDASITIGNGPSAYSVTSSSNTFSDVMPGVTITAKAVSDDPVTIGVERDGAAMAKRVGALVTAVNDALADIKKLTAYDASSGKGATLTGDMASRQATQALTRALTSAVEQSSLYTAAGVGIKVDRYGAVSFDEAKFLSAYEADPAQVERMFTQGATASSNDLSLLSAGSRVKAGDFNVIVTQAATKANQIGLVGSFPITEPATIRIKVGSTEMVLALGASASPSTPASASDIASEINTQLRTAGVGLTATAADGGIRLETNAFGSGASFQVSWTGDVGDYTSASGTDVQGTINGVIAKGVGQNLSLDSTSGELSGLTLLTGASTGAFTVSYEPGIAQRLLEAVSNATDSRFGYLSKAKESREAQVKRLSQSIEDYEVRLDARELRLRSQFAALETMLNGISTTSSMLTQMTASLGNKNDK